MTHVIVEGPCSAEAYYSAFQKASWNDAGVVFKTKECYLSRQREEALVESLVVEGGRAQSFFVSLCRRDDGVMVRLLPATDPEKTDGVKRLLAHVAEQIKTQHSACRYGHTNLQQYILDEV